MNILWLSLVLGCASGLTTKSENTNSNQQPKVRHPLKATGASSREVVDATTLQTQADFFVTQAELQSYEGHSQLAIKSFKSALIYDPKSHWIHYRLANELMKSGQLAEAKQITETALKLKPDFFEVRTLRATLFMAEKKYQEAIKEYQSILSKDPQHPESLMYLGAIHSELKDLTRAKEYFVRLAKSPKFSNPHLAHYYLGRVTMEEKKKNSFVSALKYFEKSLNDKPDFAEGALAVGQIYFILGQNQKAIELYKGFQKRHGPILKIAEILSQHYLSQSDYDNAFEQLEVLEQGGDDPLSAKLKMALILVDKNLYADAIAKFKEIEKEAPESDKVKFYLAAIYEEQKNYPASISYYTQVPVESSFYGESTMHLALLYQKSNKPELFVNTLVSAIENKVNHAPVYMLYSSYLEQTNRLAQAFEVMKLATQRFSDSAQVHFYMATIYDKQNQKSEMLKSLRTSVELDDKNPQVLNYLAYSLAELNLNLDEAEAYAKRAVATAPKDPYILDTLGWVQFKKGNKKEALTHIQKAYEISPEVSVFSEHLAELYLAKNDEVRAREFYIRAYETEEDPEKRVQLKEKIASIENRNNIQVSERFPASVPKSDSGGARAVEKGSGGYGSQGNYKDK